MPVADTSLDLHAERVQPEGGTSVVRLIILWKNAPTDPEAFERHYREVHVPLAKQMAGLRRYTISRNVTPVRGEPYFRVAELDWDDMLSFREAVDSAAGRATAADVAVLATLSSDVQSMVFELEDV